MSRLFTIESGTSSAHIHRESTLSLVGEGVKVQVYGENDNAYISADIIQIQAHIQPPQWIRVEKVETVDEVVQVSGKVSTSIRFAIIVKWITQDLFEFYPNPDGSFLIELSEPGTYTLQSSINPSVNVKVIVYSIVKNEV
jgi:hypothetical protein